MEFRLPAYDTVLEIHQIIIETFGGLDGLPHPEIIKAALVRPQSYMSYAHNCDIHLVAALILDSLTRNHAFADGNKRTALTATLMTYNLNLTETKLNYGLHMNSKFEELVLEVATKKPPIKVIRNKLKTLIEEFSA